MGEFARPSETDDGSSSAASPPRRFAIGDGMIVVALAACLLAWFLNPSSTLAARAIGFVQRAPGIVRYLYFDGPRPDGFRMTGNAGMIEYLRFTPLNISIEFGLPVLALSTLAFLPIRLRKPRPPWRDLLRQPGTVAILAVVLGILIEVDLRWMFDVEVPAPMPVSSALAVIAAWLALGITRLWRAEPSWVDRLGRVLGVGWIALGLLFAVIWYSAD